MNKNYVLFLLKRAEKIADKITNSRKKLETSLAEQNKAA